MNSKIFRLIPTLNDLIFLFFDSFLLLNDLCFSGLYLAMTQPRRFSYIFTNIDYVGLYLRQI